MLKILVVFGVAWTCQLVWQRPKLQWLLSLLAFEGALEEGADVASLSLEAGRKLQTFHHADSFLILFIAKISIPRFLAHDFAMYHDLDF